MTICQLPYTPPFSPCYRVSEVEQNCALGSGSRVNSINESAKKKKMFQGAMLNGCTQSTWSMILPPTFSPCLSTHLFYTPFPISFSTKKKRRKKIEPSVFHRLNGQGKLTCLSGTFIFCKYFITLTLLLLPSIYIFYFIIFFWLFCLRNRRGKASESV